MYNLPCLFLKILKQLRPVGTRSSASRGNAPSGEKVKPLGEKKFPHMSHKIRLRVQHLVNPGRPLATDGLSVGVKLAPPLVGTIPNLHANIPNYYSWKFLSKL